MGGNKKSKAPPLMLILLWHHFCFYKRHYVQLIVLIILPIVQVLMIWFLAQFMTNGKFLSMVNIPEDLNEGNVKKLPTSYVSSSSQPPLLLSQLENDIKSLYERMLRFDEKLDRTRFYDELPKNASNAKFFDYMKLCQLIFLPGYSGSFRRFDELKENRVVLYYPTNTTSIRSLMTIFQQELSLYRKGAPTNYTRYTNDIEQFQKCYGEQSPTVRGFQTYSDALNFARTEVKEAGNGRYYEYGNRIKYLWAIVDLSHFATDPVDPGVTYDVIYDKNSANIPYERGLFLQDLLERSIVRFMAGQMSQTMDLGVEIMPLPNKCWLRCSDYLQIILKYILAALIIGGFTQPAVNCVHLLITERSLKLREYMCIMGVGRLYLKFSWALFFLLFIIPLSIIVALLIAYLPGNPFGNFDASLIVLVVVLYNLAQLAFCFLLASIIKKPGNTGVLINFLVFFFWMIAIFMFNNLKDMRGTYVIFARLMSLIFTTPLTIAGIYMSTWGQVWLAAKWGNLFSTPVEVDEYGGIGMCIVWLVVDTILYILLSWYVDRVFPGDFGQRHPFYFFLLPSYWCPGKFGKSQRAKDIEEVGLELSDNHRMETGKLGDDQQLEAGIEVDDLTKIYPGGIVGVHNLSIQFPKNSITAFLGHNGAGKSTTMNTIVGLLSPTKGTVYVDGKDVQTNMEEIRKDVAFVPQYDILYPDLTLEEHLQFYGWLKGMSKADINQQLKPLLEQMDLTKAAKTTATNLSGGQKRKLSMIIAYLGNPAYIILDEPTSGVDPFSRRFIWDMVLNNRRGATTILSTHQMDEADLLGDRIAIISAGSLQCYGTSLDLKNQYGTGFELVVALGADADPKVIGDLKKFIGKTFAVDPEMVELSGDDITAIIPLQKGKSEEMVSALQALDYKLAEIGGKISYGVSEPSLEEVFFKATDHHEVSKAKTDEHVRDDGLHLSQRSDQVNYKKQSRISWLGSQILGQVEKRFHYSRRSIVGLMYQIILPVSFIALMLIIGSKLMVHVTDARMPVSLQKSFYTNMWFYKSEGATTKVTEGFLNNLLETGIGPGCAKGSKLPLSSCSKPVTDKGALNKKGNAIEIPDKCSCKSHCKDRSEYRKILPMVTVPTGDIVYGTEGVSNTKNDLLLSKWVFAVNGSKFITMGGFHFKKKNNLIRLWSKPEQIPAILNGFNNILARSASGRKDISISMNLRQVVIDNTQENQYGNAKEGIARMLASLFILFAFAFASFGTSFFIMYEKENGLKRLQFLAGANRTIYWVVNFVWDYIYYCITAGIIILMLYAVRNFFTNTVYLVATIAFPYGLMIISFVYLLSFVFKSYRAVVIFLIVSIIICMIAGPIISMLEHSHIFMCFNRDGKNCKNSFPWTQVVGHILRIFPPYYIMDGLTVVSSLTFSLGDRRPEPTTPENKESTSEMLSFLFNGSVFRFEILGKHIIWGITFGVLYFLLVLLLENFGEHCSCRCCTKTQAPKPVKLDPDVQKEEAEVSQSKTSNDPLQVKNITKYYPSMKVPAVNNVTFGIRRSQCFGLLGVNGAGKTTLFRMVTGYLTPSSGTTFIEQKDMYKNPRFAESKVMYCPQDNTLYDCLTVREHLEVFSKLLAIPSREAKEIIQLIMNEMDLRPHEKKLAHRLSGGNQRKLQFALAIMGYPSIIFLDEPTSGMDPGARRNTWLAIERAIENRGCSVMLTSHSMEECEALCHRLVIMVAGNLQCIGSIQYLKNKFGNRYTIKVRLNPDEPEQAVKVKSFIDQALQNKAYLVDEQATQLHYEIDSAYLPRLSFLFELMHQCKQQFGIESFSVSQVKLEHVFTNMVQAFEKSQFTQAQANAGAPVPV